MKAGLPAALLALAAAAGAGPAAYAAKSAQHENDALTDFARARVSLTQAVAAAEQTAGGKATRAELEGEHSAVVYRVEIVDPSSRKVTDVHVDGVTGKVLKATADRDEHEDRETADD